MPDFLGSVAAAAAAIRPTASGFGVLAACPGSATLRRVREDSTHASAGRAIHAWLQRVTEAVAAGADRHEAAADAALDLAPAHRVAVAAMDIDELPVDGMAAEVALAWDVVTDDVREIGRGLSRDEYLAELRPTEVGGQLDAVGWSPGARRVVVVDYKTGWSEQAADSWQQRVYAPLMAARWMRAKEAVSLVVRVRAGDPWVSRRLWDALDIDCAPSEARAVLAAAADAMASDRPVVLRIGPHCTYCPARRVCPAIGDQLRALSARDPDAPLVPMSPQELGAVWGRIEVARAALSRMEGDLKRLARSCPVPLDPDLDVKGRRRYLGEVDSHRDMLDGDAAYQQIEAMYGREIAEIAAPRPEERAGLWKHVQAAARALKRRGEFATNRGAEQALRDQLLATGAAARRHYSPVKAYRAEPCVACGVGQAMKSGQCRDCEGSQT